MAKSLASFIERIHYEDNPASPRETIFATGVSHFSPTLETGRVNRILVYPGSFNPPHRGHEELLCNGFWNSGRDLNLVAAIILPMDHERLVRKFRREENPIIFTKAERSKLLNGHSTSDWHWTYDRSEVDWFSFQKRLTEAIVKEGFALSWVLLLGPDYVRFDHLPNLFAWGCRDIVVSGVGGRAADFASSPEGGLLTLPNCEPWEGITVDFEAHLRSARQRASWFNTGIFSYTLSQYIVDDDRTYLRRFVRSLYNDSIKADQAIMFCRRTENRVCTIRYLPIQSGMTDMSSTRVREVIRSGLSEEQLFNELQQLVTFPKILMELIQGRV